MNRLSVQKYWLKLSGYGALWLMAATLITKLIGVLQKIPLQNYAGDSVFGIYNVVYPIYQLMMALAIAGIPTALASYIAGLQSSQRANAFRTAFLMSVGAALLLSVLLYATAPYIASIIGHSQVVRSLQVLSAALLLTPIIAVYRGYYQGINKAKVSSISQLIEQLIRVLCMVLALWMGLSLHWSDSTIAAAVMWGSVIGAAITLGWFIIGGSSLSVKGKEAKTCRAEASQIWKLALPTALATIVVPMVAVVDALSIPRLLAVGGLADSEIMAVFGQYSRIQPLTQLVSMLLASLAAGFLPRWINEAGSLQRQLKPSLGQRLYLMHHIAWLVGCGAAAGLYMLSEPINIMLYKDTAGIEAFRLLCFTALTSSLLAVQAPLLQGAGITRLPIWLLFAAAGSKVVFNIWLIPAYGIQGAAVAANLALLLPACIGAYALYRASRRTTVAPLAQYMYTMLKRTSVVVFALLLMVLSINGFQRLWMMSTGDDIGRTSMSLFTIAAVIIGGLIYVLVLWIGKAITKQNIKELV